MAEQEMTDEQLDEHFRQLVDIFIDQANGLVKSSTPENISLALLHAASRFNAHVVSTHAPTLADYNKDYYKARDFFINQYEEMLEQNMSDYKKIYDTDKKLS